MDNENICGSEEAVEMFCERCKKKNKNRSADGLCKNCVIYFCSKCLDDHSYHQSDHVLTDKNGMPKDVCIKVCPGHADEIIKFYCAKCDKVVCSLCKTKDHNNCENVSHLPHIVEDLENKDEFKSFVKEIEDIVSETSDLESDIERKNVLVESIASGIKSQMNTINERLHQMADARIETITKDVEATKEKDKKSLAVDALKLSVIKSEITALNSDVQKLLRETKRCELFIIMKESCVKGKDLKSDLQKLKERDITDLRFEEEIHCNRLFEAASSFGKLVFKHPAYVDEQNDKDKSEKTLTQEEVVELVAVKDEEIRRLNTDMIHLEAKYAAQDQYQRNLKHFDAVKSGEVRRLKKDTKDFEAKYSALEKEQSNLKDLVNVKDEKIRRLKTCIKDYEATYSTVEKEQINDEISKDDEIRRLKKEILDLQKNSTYRYGRQLNTRRAAQPPEESLATKDKEISRLNEELRESKAKYSALERKHRQVETLKDIEIEKLKKEIPAFKQGNRLSRFNMLNAAQQPEGNRLSSFDMLNAAQLALEGYGQYRYGRNLPRAKSRQLPEDKDDKDKL